MCHHAADGARVGVEYFDVIDVAESRGIVALEGDRQEIRRSFGRAGD